MNIKKAATKFIRYLIVGGLTITVVCAYGILSFSGTVTLLAAPSVLFLGLAIPTLLLAWTAFCLNGVIDGQVILDNIAGGIKDPKYLSKRGWHTLIVKSMETYLSKVKDTNVLSRFEQDYIKWHQYLHDLRQEPSLSPKDKAKKKFAKKLIHRMQKYFVAKVLVKADGKVPLFNKALTGPTFDELFNHVVTELPTIHYKIWALRFSVPICICAGIVVGLAAASALTAAATASLPFLLPYIWHFAIPTMIGYGFLTFHNMKRIIFSDTFDKWQNKLSDWFIYKKDQNKVKYALRVLAASILIPAAIGLSIIATLTTGYTWWSAIESGFIRKLFTPMAVFANLLFMLKNSMDSVTKLLNIDFFTKQQKPHKCTGHHHSHEHKHDHQHTHEKNSLAEDNDHGHNHSTIPELARKIMLSPILVLSACWNWAFNQPVFNPFRLIELAISIPYETVIFIGHSVSVGLVGDQYPGWEKISAIAGALADMFVDLCYIFVGHNHHHHASSKIKTNPSFSDALKQAFGIHTPVEKNSLEDAAMPTISTAWLQEEIALRAHKERTRIKNSGYINTITHSTIRKVTALENIMQKNISNLPASISAQTIFKPKTIYTDDFAKKMQRDYGNFAKKLRHESVRARAAATCA